MIIFISYGHDVYAPIAMRLYNDLEEMGESPYIDKRIRAGRDWTRELQDALDACDIVIALIAAHAMREDAAQRHLLPRRGGQPRGL